MGHQGSMVRRRERRSEGWGCSACGWLYPYSRTITHSSSREKTWRPHSIFISVRNTLHPRSQPVGAVLGPNRSCHMGLQGVGARTRSASTDEHATCSRRVPGAWNSRLGQTCPIMTYRRGDLCGKLARVRPPAWGAALRRVASSRCLHAPECGSARRSDRRSPRTG
jgi:hypothetical protein